MVLRVTLTGRVALVHDDARVDDAGLGRLGRLALAYLVSERHRPVTHHELAEVLWADDLPRSWATSLRGTVGKLRAWLASADLRAATLVTTPGCYQLQLPDDVVVDVEEAEAAARQAAAAVRAGRAAEARDLAGAAIEVTGRAFLPGVGGLWAEQRQSRLDELRVQALVVLADAALADGDPTGALAAAQEALAQAPLREAAHARVIAAHAAGGNRAEALRAYERCRRTMVEELGVGPSAEVDAVYARVLSGDAEAPATPVAPTRPAPPSTTFVGRHREVAEVQLLLGTSRLVTLVGTGGVGKTRLALAVIAQRPEDVQVVELAPVLDPGLVVEEAMASLGVRDARGHDELGALAAHLGAGPHLLFLDNCEHVIDACAELVDALMARCPGLSVLATSREPLRLAGETTWRVPSLAAADAMDLFVDRARQACPDLLWDDADEASHQALAKVCRRLDGIPLALELAAARTRVLSIAEIAERLDDRFRLLTGGGRSLPARHQTLRAAVDWTYQSLPTGEATLFDRLSVFADHFTLDAAEAVCVGGDPDGGDVLALLASLVDRSLVLVERPGVTDDPGPAATRYRLLETLRQYGRERLTAPGGDGAAARDRHLAWVMSVVADADRGIAGPEQARWLAALEAVHDDVRAALAWAGEVGGEALPRLACGLGRFWEVRGHLAEGRAWLEAAVAAPHTAAGANRARALDLAGILAQRQGDYDVAAQHYRDSLAVHRRLGHDEGVAAGLHGLGNLAALRGDLGEAKALYEESLAIGRRLHDDGICAAALTNLGSVAQNQGHLRQARELIEQSLAIRRHLGDDHDIALLTGNLGYLAFQEGDLATARELGETSLAMRRRLGDRAGAANALCNLGYVALREGDLPAARALLDSSLALAEEVGDRQAITLALLRLARVARAGGDLETAAALDRRSMPLTTQLGAKRAIAEWLEGVAATAAARNEAERVAMLLAAASTLRDAIGAPLPASECAARDADLGAARAALGEQRFDRAWRQGVALSVDQAIDRAL